MLQSREDYEWASAVIAEHKLAGRCELLMSTVFDKLTPETLVEWIMEDNLPVRMQLQMHKYIWDPRQRGV